MRAWSTLFSRCLRIPVRQSATISQRTLRYPWICKKRAESEKGGAIGLYIDTRENWKFFLRVGSDRSNARIQIYPVVLLLLDKNMHRVAIEMLGALPLRCFTVWRSSVRVYDVRVNFASVHAPELPIYVGVFPPMYLYTDTNFLLSITRL